ncbi:MAG: formate dehydrogenase accessory sulfurtransferase FdhD [Methanocorpusculum sp.]|nr:formate dehydrogenase accessory sulfurtransferase FdhD [Methanocorpusculum sp.]
MKTDCYSEKPVQIVVNGRATLTLMTHADDFRDLVTGALYTERVIETIADVESVICEGSQVSVVTKNPYAILLSRKTVLAGCGGASSFLDSGKLGHVHATAQPADADIASACAAVGPCPWFAGGLFAAGGREISRAEDISAQNVFDRLIGHALTEGVDFSSTFAVLKGNLTVESVRKAVIAGIPVLAVCGAATSAALATAEAAGLLIVFR